MSIPTFSPQSDAPAQYPTLLNITGCVLIKQVFSSTLLQNLSDILQQSLAPETVYQRHKQVFAMRNLLDKAPDLKPILNAALIEQWVEPVVGPKAQIIRAIYFNKPPAANWKVPWHQDTTIAVQTQKDIPDFSAWTQKAGVPTVQAPASLLEKTLTLRIHLDDTDESNGALRVLPGSHLAGKLGPAQIENARQSIQPVSCVASSGDILAMRPLSLHASATGSLPRQRRVIHLEFSAETLPNGLEWYGT
jgi:ectoine hydroxylase-related dioxygenase (phytanoyl-CoA dioxygenase family)